MRSTFLAEVLAGSRERSACASRARPAAELRRAALARSAPPALVLSPQGFDVIAEIKLRSPALGVLGEDSGTALEERARSYAAAGAACISVLTEPTRFAGELEHVERVAASCDVPVLRKDFLVDPYQVWEARAAGASGVLVIVRALTDPELEALLVAASEAGLFVLLEAFDAADLARARAVNAAGAECIVGVNGRDLSTLAVHPERPLALARALPPGAIAVAESGLTVPADAAAARRAGYRLALVGTALMRAADPEGLVRELLAAGRNAGEDGEVACGSS